MNTSEQNEVNMSDLGKNHSFQLRSLWVKDFFKLRDFNIQFNSNISVIIGENGSGKSTVIECIADIFGHLFKYFVLNDTNAAFIDNYIIEYFIESKTIYIESHYSDSDTNTFAPIIKIDGSLITATETPSQRKNFIQYLPSKIILSYSGITKQLYALNKHFEDKYIKEIISTNKKYSLQPLLLPNENPFLYIKEEYVSFIALALMALESDAAEKLLNTIGVDVNSCKISISIKKPSWAKSKKTSTYPWGIQGKIATDFIDGLNKFGSLKEKEEDKERLQYDFYGVLDIQSFFEFFNLSSDQVLTFFDTLLCDDLLEFVKIEWKRDKETYSLDRLSEGEKQLLLSEGLCEVLNQKNILLLMDEPDVSLHPKWQREFIPTIRKNWGLNSTAIITTHSPFLIQSLENETLFAMDRILEERDFDSLGLEDIVETEMGMKQKIVSLKYENKYNLAEQYFQLVKAGKDGTQEIAEVKSKLDELEQQIGMLHDPAYEAYLKFKRGNKI